MDNHILENHGLGDQDFYQFKYEGKTVTVGKYDTDFFEKLRKLPAGLKIRMMDISLTDLEHYYAEQKLLIEIRLLEHFKTKWKWRESGDAYNLNDPYTNLHLFGYKLKKSEFVSRIKRGGFGTIEMDRLLYCFENENGELIKI